MEILYVARVALQMYIMAVPISRQYVYVLYGQLSLGLAEKGKLKLWSICNRRQFVCVGCWSFGPSVFRFSQIERVPTILVSCNMKLLLANNGHPFVNPFCTSSYFRTK